MSTAPFFSSSATVSQLSSYSPQPLSDSSSSSGSSNSSSVAEGSIEIAPSTELNGRYVVSKVAGKGTFGTVLEVYDRKHRESIALKVVRSVPRYLDAARTEIEILKTLRSQDPMQKSLCVRYLRHFEIFHNHQRHVCIGFEKLGKSLYDFIKKNDYRGFQIETVREFSFQLIQAVSFCHSIGLTHTDLKLENILLVDSSYTIEGEDYRVPVNKEIRVIDFGGATFEGDHHSRIVNTRQYRAPEVVLSLPWSFPSDLWCCACIMMELLTGDLLFQTHQDLEHLALMEKILEKQLPQEMCDKAVQPYRDRERQRERERKRKSKRRGRSESPRRNRSALSSSSSNDSNSVTSDSRARSSSSPRVSDVLSVSSGKLRWPSAASSESSIERVKQAKTLKTLLRRCPDPNFLDLLQRLLVFDPRYRLTASQALRHPFFDPLRRNDEKETQERERERERDRDRERERTREREQEERRRHEDERRSNYRRRDRERNRDHDNNYDRSKSKDRERRDRHRRY
jgi:serine/threonine protein kinase